MTNTYQPTLRDQIIARRNRSAEPTALTIPLTGLIAPDVVVEIQRLAIDAKKGDEQARDVLYTTFEKRLGRMGYVLRPWPNTPSSTGIWDRDDVNQEGWLVFVDLLSAWESELPFVPYLFARYPWRLRDRILRGIGKPLPPIGEVRISEERLATSVYASDDEQPESALMAAGLLEQLIKERLGEDQALGELTILRSPERRGERPSAESDSPFPRVKEA